MEISAGIQASLPGRYASALFELAAEGGVVTAVETDLDTLDAALAESGDLRAVTTNPAALNGVTGGTLTRGATSSVVASASAIRERAGT